LKNKKRRLLSAASFVSQLRELSKPVVGRLGFILPA
jgi:hypothetical protein